MLLSFLHPVCAQIECRKKVFAGDPILIFVTFEGAAGADADVSVRLLNAMGETVSGARGYSPENVQREHRSIAILGVPSTLKAGTYTIKVEEKLGDAVRVMSRELAVLSRTFPFEAIVFDEKMTALMRVKDPRKDEEARRLYALLMNFYPKGQHQFDYFSLPVRGGKRTSAFGDIREYLLDDDSKMTSVHRGIDFGLPPGEPVMACGRGRIVMAEFRIMTGNTAVIEHLPGLYSLYYHLDRLDVAEDNFVEQGQYIGTIGSTGLATGAHLHWEVRTGGVAIDLEAFTRSDIVDMDRLRSYIERQ